jgi:hypothetical protein
MRSRRIARKSVGKLTADDLVAFPVWEYVNEDAGNSDQDETWLRPVDTLPIHSAEYRVIGTRIRLANGFAPLAMLGNIDLARPDRTAHFLAISVFGPKGDTFDLARYHDADAGRRSPEALAAFLGLRVEDVFPIEYDIAGLVLAEPGAAQGVVEARPRVTLTDEELVSLAIT